MPSPLHTPAMARCSRASGTKLSVSLLCHRPSRAASCSKYGGGGGSSLQSREAVAVCAFVVRSACPKGLPHRAVVSSSVQPLQVKMLTVGFRMVLSRVSDASSSAGSRDGFRLPFKLVKTRPRNTVSALNPRRNSLRTSCEDAQGKLQGKCPSAEHENLVDAECSFCERSIF